ncbi:transmembrane protein 176A [Heteronotia binoei]|uniref:transmembrane protein 176A n=1 Tax=Heteronotia binoei TaxID=13085 RepID=UPI00292DA8C8|nr:transmembrane protein 176A [Heteronotia binoei]XP_060103866.1 transmembrane protein 176A [Heteronotia binoei]
MAASLVKVNGTEVSVEDSGKTVINVNICQESSLSYLVKAMAAAGRKMPRLGPAPKTLESSAPAPSPGRAPCNGEQKVLGGAQILLGVMCFGLGGVLCLLNDYIPMRYSGAPFWMGSLFVVSGSLCVVSERRGGCCWTFLSIFFNLASFVAGCVGLATGVAELPYLHYTPYWVNDACNRQRDYYGSWQPTRRPDDLERVERCKNRMMNLLNIVSGAQILLLIFSVAALGIALFCFGYGLRVLCCTPRANTEDHITVGDLEAPLTEVPPPYEEPTKENTAA